MRTELHPDCRAFLKALQKVMKSKKVTYAKLAGPLGVSTVTVKRWFTGQTCSFERIFEICEQLDVKFYDLAALAGDPEEVEYVLSQEQELFFSKNPAYFGILKMLHNGVEPRQIGTIWNLTPAALFRTLRNLEKLGVIEVLPDEKVRLKTRGHIRYAHRGPLAKAILRPQVLKFLDHIDRYLENDDVALHSAELELSEASISELVEEIHALGAKYRKRALRDKSLLPKDKLRSTRWLLAFSPYETDWSQYELKLK